MEATSTHLIKLKPFWSDPGMFATSLLTLFIDCYGTEAFNWDPVTIQMEIEDDTGADMPAVNFSRLIAAIDLHTTNNFFQSVPDFLQTCVVLSGHAIDEHHMILPDSADLAWGVTEALLISPPEESNENPFTPEITGYIGHVLDTEGILNPPDILRIATRDRELLDRVNYEYSDDPEMFGAINKMEGGKTDDINIVVRGRMMSLILQLQQLPLRNGKLEAIAAKMLQSLPKDTDPLPLPT
jgi:hypothetical protein